MENKKYVCFSMQSTAQCKYWNYPNGWKILINHLKSIGYEAYCIDKHTSFGYGSMMNYIPDNAVNKTGLSVTESIELLKGATFFIGISSGLSWLAWSVGIPVVLISGMTPPWYEFQTNTERIFKSDVCNGCFADVNHKFDTGDWSWCPMHKGTSRQFECTKTITPEYVFNKILEFLTSNSAKQTDSNCYNIIVDDMIWRKQYNKYFKPKNNDVIVDIGANFGLYSLISTIGINIKKCYCIEPFPTNAGYIRKNIEKIAKYPEKYEVFETAISDKTGTGVLNLQSISSPSLIEYSITQDKSNELLTVGTTTLKDFITKNEITHINILKIDAEGAEYPILLDEWNVNFIKNNVDKLVGELHLLSLENKPNIVRLIENINKCDMKLIIDSVDGINITRRFINENGTISSTIDDALNYYTEVIFYAMK